MTIQHHLTPSSYNADGIIASVKAAEQANAPAIVEIFPWSIHFQGPDFVKFAADLVHHAKVPMALHLDHCTERDDVFIALELPFDSIMVDASSEDPEENIKFVASIVEKAKERNISIEAEMGRIQGGEDGLAHVDLEALYTEPDFAADFVKKTGVHFLAPSFGNIHGIYPPGGPAKFWQLDRLEQIHKQNPNLPLVLHGVPHDFDDELMKKTVELGIRKVNFNRNLHDPYLEFLSKNIGKLEMTGLQKGSIDAFAAEAKRNIELLGSAGKA